MSHSAVPDSQTIAQSWRDRPYQDVSTLTLSTQSLLLQDVVQTALRHCTVHRLRRVTADRRFRRVLDLACGVGDWTADYLTFADSVVAVDVNPGFLKLTAQRAQGAGAADRLEVRESRIQDFRDYQGADLVCLGACTVLVDDRELDEIFARIAGGIVPGGIVYVRSTVTKPLRRPYTTSGGFYRTRDHYERCFAAHELEILDTASSVGLIVTELAMALAGVPEGSVEALVRRALPAALQIASSLSGRIDRLNWILRASPRARAVP